MKIVLVLIVALLSACSHSYSVGLPQSMPLEEASILKTSFDFEIYAIDDIAFKSKRTISAVGTNTISLAPGQHTVTFRYCQCSMAEYITSPVTTLNFSTESGKTYRLEEFFEGGGIASGASIRFEIGEE